jgi:hypothetical protein
LLDSFDRGRFIASAAIGRFSALPAEGLSGKQAGLGRPKAWVCFALLRPAQLDGAALIVAESFGTDGRFTPILLQKSFCRGYQNFRGPLARFSCRDVTDLVASR